MSSSFALYCGYTRENFLCGIFSSESIRHIKNIARVRLIPDPFHVYSGEKFVFVLHLSDRKNGNIITCKNHSFHHSFLAHRILDDGQSLFFLVFDIREARLLMLNCTSVWQLHLVEINRVQRDWYGSYQLESPPLTWSVTGSYSTYCSCMGWKEISSSCVWTDTCDMCNRVPDVHLKSDSNSLSPMIWESFDKIPIDWQGLIPCCKRIRILENLMMKNSIINIPADLVLLMEEYLFPSPESLQLDEKFSSQIKNYLGHLSLKPCPHSNSGCLVM